MASAPVAASGSRLQLALHSVLDDLGGPGIRYRVGLRKFKAWQSPRMLRGLRVRPVGPATGRGVSGVRAEGQETGRIIVPTSTPPRTCSRSTRSPGR